MRLPLIAAPMVMGIVLGGLCVTARADGPNGDWFRGQTVRPDTAPQGPGAANAGRDFGQAPAANGPMGNGQQAGGMQSDFPQDPVHDWVVATARAARSRALLHLAEKQLNDSIRDAQSSFEQSREYRDAVATEKQAYDAYNAQRQKALQSVVHDPKYVAAIELRDQLADKLEHLRALARPNPLPREDLLAIASQKLQYASDAHNMEREALENNAAVQDARQKMVQASARVSELRASFDNSVRMNPQIAQARSNLDMARVELITAEAYYGAAAEASVLATDYSYYRHRWDGVAAPVIAGGWGPYGYNQGY
jgi:hypothetical protein